MSDSDSSTSDKVKAVVAAVITTVSVATSSDTKDQLYAKAEKLEKERTVQELKNDTASKSKAKTSQEDD